MTERNAFVGETLHEAVDFIVDGALSFPKVELDSEYGEVSIERIVGDCDEVFPEAAVAGPAGLELARGDAGALQGFGIFLATGGRARVELLEVFQRDGTVLGVFAFESGIEIGQVRRFA